MKVVSLTLEKGGDNDSLLGVGFSSEEYGRKEWWLLPSPACLVLFSDCKRKVSGQVVEERKVACVPQFIV